VVATTQRRPCLQQSRATAPTRSLITHPFQAQSELEHLEMTIRLLLAVVIERLQTAMRAAATKTRATISQMCQLREF